MFFNVEFARFRFDELEKGDFVYADPPYFNSVAAYNEQGGWTEKHEQCLLANLDELNQRGISFALSNNLKYDNPLLDEWKSKYNVHYLNTVLYQILFLDYNKFHNYINFHKNQMYLK